MSVNQVGTRGREAVSSGDKMIDDDDDGQWSWKTRRTRKWSAGSTGNPPGGTIC